MAFGYHYTLQAQENGWWLVRFPAAPEALTEGETEVEARLEAADCIVAALEGYMKGGRALPRETAADKVGELLILPSLVTAKLAVYEHMRQLGWTKVKLAQAVGLPENSIRRLLDLRHNSHMGLIDEALAKMDAALDISLPKARSA